MDLQDRTECEWLKWWFKLYVALFDDSAGILGYYSVEQRVSEYVTRWRGLGKKRLWRNRVVQNMSEERSKTMKHSG